MCDYCDCRSEPEIAALSADHDRLRAEVGDAHVEAFAADHESVHSLVAAAAAGDIRAAEELRRHAP